jgi:hypothetical protein
VDQIADRIIAICSSQPRTEWRRLIIDTLNDYTTTVSLMDQITVTTGKPGAPQPLNPTFRPIAKGETPDGRKFTVHDFMGINGPGGKVEGPHRAGVPLTAEEIKATVNAWNDKDQAIARGARHGLK